MIDYTPDIGTDLEVNIEEIKKQLAKGSLERGGDLAYVRVNDEIIPIPKSTNGPTVLDVMCHRRFSLSQVLNFEEVTIIVRSLKTHSPEKIHIKLVGFGSKQHVENVRELGRKLHSGDSVNFVVEESTNALQTKKHILAHAEVNKWTTTHRAKVICRAFKKDSIEQALAAGKETLRVAGVDMDDRNVQHDFAPIARRVYGFGEETWRDALCLAVETGVISTDEIKEKLEKIQAAVKGMNDVASKGAGRIPLLSHILEKRSIPLKHQTRIEQTAHWLIQIALSFLWGNIPASICTLSVFIGLHYIHKLLRFDVAPHAPPRLWSIALIGLMNASIVGVLGYLVSIAQTFPLYPHSLFFIPFLYAGLYELATRVHQWLDNALSRTEQEATVAPATESDVTLKRVKNISRICAFIGFSLMVGTALVSGKEISGLLLSVFILLSAVIFYECGLKVVERLIIKDRLTGVYNRRYFDEQLERELQRGYRNEKPVALLMIDIDNFKNVNDTWGHRTGDKVLRHVAQVIQECIQRTNIDSVSRYGGEEFAVILPDTDAYGAQEVANRIRQRVEETAFLDNHPVTVSIGFSVFPHFAAAAKDLIEQADQALLLSKETGRNRITPWRHDFPENVVDERVRLRQHLREQEAQIRNMLQNIEGLLYEGGMDWSVTFRPDQAQQIRALTDYDRKDFEKLTWKDLIFKEDIAGAEQAFIAALKSEKDSRYVRQYRIRKKNGDSVWIEDRGIIIFEDDTLPNDGVAKDKRRKVASIIGFFYDITEQKKLEERFQTKQRLIQTLHDFETEISHVDVLGVINRALEFITKRINVDRLSVALLDEKGEQLSILDTTLAIKDLDKGQSVPFGSIAPSSVITSRESLYRPDIRRSDLTFEGDTKLFEAGIQSDYIVPLLIEGKCIGTLNCGVAAIDGIREENRRFLDLMAPRLAHAFNEARVFESLKESEEKYRHLVKHAPAGIYTIDIENNRFSSVNDTMCIFTGYTREEFLTMGCFDVFTEESQKLFMERIEKLSYEEEVPETVEYAIKAKNGTVYWVILNLRYKFVAGKPMGATVIVHDITQLKRTQEALRESEILLSLISKNLRDTIWIVDINTLKYIYISGGVEAMRGFTQEEASGRSFADNLTPESLEYAMGIFTDELANDAERDPNRSRTMEVKQYHKDGSTIWTELTIKFLRDETGKPDALIGSTRDIRERKQIEQKLAESEARYRTILEDVEEGYFEVDLKGTMQFCNDSMCEIVGYQKNELIGMNNRQYMNKKTAHGVYQTFNRIFTADISEKGFEWELIRKDGTKRYVEVSVSLRKDSKGQPIGFRGLARDVTDRKYAEQQLKASQEKFEKAFHSSPNLMAITCKQDGRIIDVNESFLNTLEFNREEVIGFSTIELNIWGDEDARIRALEILKEEGELHSFETQIRTKSGEMRTMLFSGVRVDLDYEECLITTASDITERKRAEEELQKAQKIAQQYFDVAASMMIVLDREGKIAAINDQGCKNLGYSVEEKETLLGMDWFDNFISEEEREKVREYFFQIIRGGRPRFEYFENYIITKDKKRRLISWHNTYLEDEQGRITSALSSGEDITDKRKAEEELKKWAHVFEAAEWGIAVSGSDGERFNMVNPAFAKMTGYAIEELKDMPIVNVYAPKFRKALSRHIAIANRNAHHTFESMYRRKDGTLFPVLVDVTVVKDKTGNVLYRIANVKDITEQKELEKKMRLTEKMAAVGQLSAGLAHELNNPLGSIAGLLTYVISLLSKNREDNTQSLEHLQHALDETERSVRLVQDLLAYARKETKEFSPLFLAPIIKESIKKTRRVLETCNVNIHTDIDKTITMFGNKNRLYEIFINLITNAAHAMRGEAERTLTITARKDSVDQTAIIEVCDTGTGMDEITKQKIFTPFFTTKNGGEGTGLGMSLVYTVVDEHGGDIDIASDLGKGTKITITFPLTQEEPVAQEETVSAIANDIVNGSVKRQIKSVLVVDDEPLQREHWKIRLEACGLTVTTADGMETAFDALGQQQYDAIITDVKMKMSDVEGFIFSVKARAAGFTGPIAVCTGFAGFDGRDARIERLVKNRIVNFGITKATVFMKGNVDKSLEALRRVEVIIPAKELIDQYEKAIAKKDMTTFEVAGTEIKPPVDGEVYVIIEGEFRHDLAQPLSPIFGFIELLAMDFGSLHLKPLLDLSEKANKLLYQGHALPKELFTKHEAIETIKSAIELYEDLKANVVLILNEINKFEDSVITDDKVKKNIQTIKTSCDQAEKLINEQFLQGARARLKEWEAVGVDSETEKTGDISITGKKDIIIEGEFRHALASPLSLISGNVDLLEDEQVSGLEDLHLLLEQIIEFQKKSTKIPAEMYDNREAAIAAIKEAIKFYTTFGQTIVRIVGTVSTLTVSEEQKKYINAIKAEAIRAQKMIREEFMSGAEKRLAEWESETDTDDEKGPGEKAGRIPLLSHALEKRDIPLKHQPRIEQTVHWLLQIALSFLLGNIPAAIGTLSVFIGLHYIHKLLRFDVAPHAPPRFGSIFLIGLMNTLAIVLLFHFVPVPALPLFSFYSIPHYLFFSLPYLLAYEITTSIHQQWDAKPAHVTAAGKAVVSRLKRIGSNFIALGFFTGIWLWCIDAYLHQPIFYAGVFLETLLNPVSHELVLRSIVLIVTTVFGAITAIAFTRRRKVEKILRESEEQYRALFQSISDALFVFDPETLQLVDVNKEAIELFGYSREEFLCLTLRDVSMETAETEESVKKTLKGEMPKTFIRQYKKKDGTAFLADVTRSLYSVKGRPVICGIVRDITELRRVEELLQKSESQFRMLFEISPDGIVIADKKTTEFIYVNPGICTLLGYTEDELVGKSLFDIHPNESIAYIKSEFDAQGRGDKVLAENIPCLKKDGSILYMDINTKPVVIKGREYNIGFFRDVTMRKQQEDALKEALRELGENTERLIRAERLSVIGEMAAGVAHEINNPASNIMNICDDILMRLNEGQKVEMREVRAIVEAINQEADRISVITARLLDFAKTTVDDKKPYFVESVLQDVVEMQRLALENRGITVNLEFNGEDAVIIGNKNRLREAFTNLVLNAAYAMEERMPKRLTIRTEKVIEQNGKGTVKVFFSDTGCGIKEENLNIIWKPFYTDRRDKKGTGLGMNNVMEVAAEHNGTVAVESTVDVGTTFTITLPMMTQQKDIIWRLAEHDQHTINGSIVHDLNNSLGVINSLDFILNPLMPDNIHQQCRYIMGKYNKLKELIKKVGQKESTTGDVLRTLVTIEEIVQELVSMSTQLKAEEALQSADNQEILEDVSQALRVMKTVIADFRAVMIGNSFKKKMEPVNVENALNDVSRFLKRSKRFFPQHSIAFEKVEVLSHLADGIFIQAEEEAFKYAVYNILLLSLEGSKTPVTAMAPEEKSLKIKVDVNERSGEIIITFKNNYCQFSDKQLERIDIGYGEERAAVFKWLKKESPSLAVAHRVITFFAGRLYIDNENEGSVIRMFIPSMKRAGKMVTGKELRADEEKRMEEAFRAEPEVIQDGRPNILIADDEFMQRKLLRRMLRDYNVWVARNGQEAFDIIEKVFQSGGKFDLAIFDITMPAPQGSAIIDGLVLTNEVRKAGYTFPIIISTGHAVADQSLLAWEEQGTISCILSKTMRMSEKMSKVKEIFEAASHKEKGLGEGLGRIPLLSRTLENYPTLQSLQPALEQVFFWGMNFGLSLAIGIKLSTGITWGLFIGAHYVHKLFPKARMPNPPPFVFIVSVAFINALIIIALPYFHFNVKTVIAFCLTTFFHVVCDNLSSTRFEELPHELTLDELKALEGEIVQFFKHNIAETNDITLWAKKKIVFEHSERVAHLSERIATAHKLDARIIQLVKIVAWLHDLGKIKDENSLRLLTGRKSRKRFSVQEKAIQERHGLGSLKMLKDAGKAVPNFVKILVQGLHRYPYLHLLYAQEAVAFSHRTVLEKIVSIVYAADRFYGGTESAREGRPYPRMERLTREKIPDWIDALEKQKAFAQGLHKRITIKILYGELVRMLNDTRTKRVIVKHVPPTKKEDKWYSELTVTYHHSRPGFLADLLDAMEDLAQVVWVERFEENSTRVYRFGIKVKRTENMERIVHNLEEVEDFEDFHYEDMQKKKWLFEFEFLNIPGNIEKIRKVLRTIAELDIRINSFFPFYSEKKREPIHFVTQIEVPVTIVNENNQVNGGFPRYLAQFLNDSIPGFERDHKMRVRKRFLAGILLDTLLKELNMSLSAEDRNRYWAALDAVGTKRFSQARKKKEYPFMSHLTEVVKILRYGCGIVDHEIFLAALLHDAIEDGDVTEDNLRKMFGGDICDVVLLLSKQPDEKESDYLRRMIAALDTDTRKGSSAILIKLADRIHSLFTLDVDDYFRRKIFFSTLDTFIEFVNAVDMAKVDPSLKPAIEKGIILIKKHILEIGKTLKLLDGDGIINSEQLKLYLDDPDSLKYKTRHDISYYQDIIDTISPHDVSQRKPQRDIQKESGPPAYFQNPDLNSEPILLPGKNGNRTGVLLIHGFGATPETVRALAEKLNNDGGVAVRAPLLPGHATSIEDFNNTTWQDWVACVEAEYKKLADDCDRIVVIGQSMGGLLALYLGSLNLPKLARIIGTAPAIRVTHKLRHIVPFMNHPRVKPFARWIKLRKKRTADGLHPLVMARWQGYTVNTFPAAYQALLLQAEVRKSLPDITVPLVIFQGTDDGLVPPESANEIIENVSSKDKQLIPIFSGTHYLMLDHTSEIVAEKIRAVIQPLPKDGFIWQGERAKAKFDEQREEIKKNDVSTIYGDRIKRILKEKRDLVPSDIQEKLKTIKMYGFDSIIEEADDFFVGMYAYENNELFIATDVIKELEGRGPPSLVDEYLLHEILCPLLGHYPAIVLQQKLFPQHYPDKELKEQQTDDNPYKGNVGTQLRNYIHKKLFLEGVASRIEIAQQRDTVSVALTAMELPLIDKNQRRMKSVSGRSGGQTVYMKDVPLVLSERGIASHVVVPLFSADVKENYGTLDRFLASFDGSIITRLNIPIGSGSVPLTVIGIMQHEVPVFLLYDESGHFFVELYSKPNPYYIGGYLEAIMLSHAPIQIFRQFDLPVNVFHFNDWQAGFGPIFLKEFYNDSNWPRGIKPASIFTVHNLEYQRLSPWIEQAWRNDEMIRHLESIGVLQYHRYFQDAQRHMYDSDTPDTVIVEVAKMSRLRPEILYGYGNTGMEHLGRHNVMKGAFLYADKILFVSKGHLEESLTPSRGFQFDGLLRSLRHKLEAVYNGIRAEGNRAENLDTVLRETGIVVGDDSYEFTNMIENDELVFKTRNAQALQQKLGLEVNRNNFLIGIVTRIVKQKGLNILFTHGIYGRPLIEELLNMRDKNGNKVQVVILGTPGEEAGEVVARRLREYEQNPDYAGQFRFVERFDPVLAKQIGAASHMALMPSIDEPGGIANQELALLLALLIVTDRGGLNDFYAYGGTPVEPVPGFDFDTTEEAEQGRMHSAREIERRVWQYFSLFTSDKDEFASLLKKVRQFDPDWHMSGRDAEFETIYKETFKNVAQDNQSSNDVSEKLSESNQSTLINTPWYNRRIELSVPSDTIRSNYSKILQIYPDAQEFYINIDAYIKGLSLFCNLIKDESCTIQKIKEALIDFQKIIEPHAAAGVDKGKEKAFIAILEEMFAEKSLPKIKRDPVRFAAKLYIKFLKLSPFYQGNHRCAAFLLNFILLKKGLPPFLLTPSNVKHFYKELRGTIDNNIDAMTAFFKEEIKKNEWVITTSSDEETVVNEINGILTDEEITFRHVDDPTILIELHRDHTREESRRKGTHVYYDVTFDGKTFDGNHVSITLDEDYKEIILENIRTINGRGFGQYRGIGKSILNFLRCEALRRGWTLRVNEIRHGRMAPCILPYFKDLIVAPENSRGYGDDPSPVRWDPRWIGNTVLGKPKTDEEIEGTQEVTPDTDNPHSPNKDELIIEGIQVQGEDNIDIARYENVLKDVMSDIKESNFEQFLEFVEKRGSFLITRDDVSGDSVQDNIVWIPLQFLEAAVTGDKEAVSTLRDLIIKYGLFFESRSARAVAQKAAQILKEKVGQTVGEEFGESQIFHEARKKLYEILSTDDTNITMNVIMDLFLRWSYLIPLQKDTNAWQERIDRHNMARLHSELVAEARRADADPEVYLKVAFLLSVCQIKDFAQSKDAISIATNLLLLADENYDLLWNDIISEPLAAMKKFHDTQAFRDILFRDIYNSIDAIVYKEMAENSRDAILNASLYIETIKEHGKMPELNIYIDDSFRESREYNLYVKKLLSDIERERGIKINTDVPKEAMDEAHLILAFTPLEDDKEKNDNSKMLTNDKEIVLLHKDTQKRSLTGFTTVSYRTDRVRKKTFCFSRELDTLVGELVTFNLFFNVLLARSLTLDGKIVIDLETFDQGWVQRGANGYSLNKAIHDKLNKALIAEMNRRLIAIAA
ncbi:MAG: alpha/beta fold hydrolase [Candidatus Omnitrophica bacterium]|nr:alpha/beta fold hydrolase [Candidatus Omnitrophota bacterium]